MADAPGITVIVPTFKRTVDLDRCLRAIDVQTLPPTEVIITYRDEDEETKAYLARPDRPALGARTLLCEQPGVVFALTIAIDTVQSEFFAITDDDSRPHPDWLARIVAHFDADPKLAGVGGKDYVYGMHGWVDETAPVVGKVLWYGKAIGNHHLGTGGPRYVETLKGVNMAFRKSIFGKMRPDPRLRGKGAQVGFEGQLSLSLIARGYRLIYDPQILVDHYISARPNDLGRWDFTPVSHQNEYFNRSLIMLEFLGTQSFGPLRQLAHLASIGLLGSRKAPGVLLMILGLITRYPDTWPRFKATMAAYRDAVHSTRRWSFEP
jgi:GT2 family glycosyltransferase